MIPDFRGDPISLRGLDIVTAHLTKLGSTEPSLSQNTETPQEITRPASTAREKVLPTPPKETDGYATEAIAQHFSEKTRKARRLENKNFQAYYEWEAGVAIMTERSILPPYVDKKDTFIKAVNSLRASELFDRGIAHLSTLHAMEFDVQHLLHRANERLALTGAQRADIWNLIALFDIMQEDPGRGEKLLLAYLPGDYLLHGFQYKAGKKTEVSAKPKKADVENWVVCAGMRVAQGIPMEQVLTELRLSKDAYQTRIEKAAVLFKEGGLSSLLGENARIVGRLVLFAHFKEQYNTLRRADNTVHQALEGAFLDLLLLHIFTLSPDDVEAKSIESLSIEDKNALVKKILGK